AMQEIILRCLEIEPARRYPSAAQLALELSDLESVTLTARAEKLKRDPLSIVLKRRFNPDPSPSPEPQAALQQLAQAPIIAVAIDLSEGSQALADALRLTVQRLLDNAPQARVACLNVIRTRLLALDAASDEDGRNKHVQRLVQLRHWAAPLAGATVTCHVLEAVSPADAILDYVRQNLVDHVVM